MIAFFYYPHPDLKVRGNSLRAADNVIFEVMAANPDELITQSLAKHF